MNVSELLTIESATPLDRKLHNKVYYPVEDTYRQLAKVRYDALEGTISLVKGSIIRLPKLSMRGCSESFYHDMYHAVMNLYNSGYLKDIGNREFKVINNIHSTNPSILATLISGYPTGGWSFFLVIDELSGRLIGE